jgi:hypothetical protein
MDFLKLPEQEQQTHIQNMDIGVTIDQLIVLVKETNGDSSETAGLIIVNDTSMDIIERLHTLGVTVMSLQSNYASPLSDNQRWDATGEGIRDHTTKQLIVPTWQSKQSARRQLFDPATWVGRDQGVIYLKNRNTYVIEGGNGPPIPLNFMEVRQPILMLDMPTTVSAP